MREHSLFFFYNIHNASVNFVLKPRICLAISKLLRTFAAELRIRSNNITALRITVKRKNMRKSIDTYVQSIASDNKQFILEGGYESVADYIVSNADNGTGYNEYFDDSETEDNMGEPTQEQIDELKEYLNDNYNYLP